MSDARHPHADARAKSNSRVIWRQRKSKKHELSVESNPSLHSGRKSALEEAHRLRNEAKQPQPNAGRQRPKSSDATITKVPSNHQPMNHQINSFSASLSAERKTSRFQPQTTKPKDPVGTATTATTATPATAASVDNASKANNSKPRKARDARNKANANANAPTKQLASDAPATSKPHSKRRPTASSASRLTKPSTNEDSRPAMAFNQVFALETARQSPWFHAFEDVSFATWLLCRSEALKDATTPANHETVALIKPLYDLDQAIRADLKGAVADSTSSSSSSSEEQEEEQQLWTVGRLVDSAISALDPITPIALRAIDEPQEESNCSLVRWCCTEVADVVTSWLLVHGTRREVSSLTRWNEFLMTMQRQMDVASSRHHAQDEVQMTRMTRKKKAASRRTGSFKKTVNHMTTFLQLVQREFSRPQQPRKLQLDPQISREVDDIFCLIRLEEQDESDRLGIVAAIEHSLRCSSAEWQRCELNLYGSSLSRFGTKGCDLDISCVMNGDLAVPLSTNNDISVGRLHLLQRQLAERNATRSCGLQKLEALARQVQNAQDQVYKSLTKHRKRKPLVVDPLVFFHTQFGLLQCILKDQIHAATTDDKHGDVASSSSALSDWKHAQDRLTRLRRQVKKRQGQVFKLRQRLLSARFKILQVLSEARVPLIRFLHPSTQLECDICFGNGLAPRNTALLRMYAEFDPRARMLGVVIKHWAKCRHIQDAAMGSLSSYAYILLVIFYLQRGVVPSILPNLQHPTLLQQADVPPELVDGVDISFCLDLRHAQKFLHAQHQCATDQPQDQETASMGELLLGFFEFFARRFDVVDHVVSIRHQHPVLRKQDKWRSRHERKSWRWSIEDPLETSRDLGSVLHFGTLQTIVNEFERAFELLSTGKSFANDVCEHKSPVGAEVTETALDAEDGSP